MNCLLGKLGTLYQCAVVYQDPPGIGEWRLAAVIDTDANAARIVLRDGTVGEISISDLRWARSSSKRPG